MSWVKKLFKRPESEKVKLKFIAIDVEGKPYEDVATVPYHDGYSELKVRNGFIHFMEVGRKHKVLEITIVEKLPDPN
jgi:hypothetical protein